MDQYIFVKLVNILMSVAAPLSILVYFNAILFIITLSPIVKRAFNVRKQEVRLIYPSREPPYVSFPKAEPLPQLWTPEFSRIFF